jgi:hypothetical protein
VVEPDGAIFGFALTIIDRSWGKDIAIFFAMTAARRGGRFLGCSRRYLPLLAAPSPRCVFRRRPGAGRPEGCAAWPDGDAVADVVTTLFRKAFHVIGNDDLRWVSLTYAFQVL